MTTKADIIDRVSDIAGITKAQVARTFEAIVETVTESLQCGESVSMTGLGTFSTKKRGGRTARNPRTGESVKVGPTVSARFSVSSTLKKALND